VLFRSTMSLFVMYHSLDPITYNHYFKQEQFFPILIFDFKQKLQIHLRLRMFINCFDPCQAWFKINSNKTCLSDTGWVPARGRNIIRAFDSHTLDALAQLIKFFNCKAPTLLFLSMFMRVYNLHVLITSLNNFVVTIKSELFLPFVLSKIT
jgi:hypothetical protein